MSRLPKNAVPAGDPPDGPEPQPVRLRTLITAAACVGVGFLAKQHPGEVTPIVVGLAAYPTLSRLIGA